MSNRAAQRVLLIGWDAADWKIIRPLIEKGLMPNLARMMEGGVSGNLSTLQPVLSPMLWTSIATGKRPSKHGIHGFTEPHPEGQGIRPVTSTSRTVKAIWNILTQEGLRANTLGWYASYPAEPINGVSVSNIFPLAWRKLGEEWPLPPGPVHPASVADELAEMRAHPAELEPDALLPFIPRAAEIDQEKDHRLFVLAKMIAECSTMQAATTWVLEHQPWDFTAVLFDAIDHFCHAFMHYRAPRREEVSELDFEIFKDVVDGAYCYHDMMLGHLLRRAGDDATVILVSDHGFHSDHLRPARTPDIPAGPAVWHRMVGICAAQGPGFKRGAKLVGAGLLDVTPTILALLGLPVGEDMDGRPWTEAFEHRVKVTTIPSWEEKPGECGMHTEAQRVDPVENQQVLKQLIALGYIEPPDKDVQQAIDKCVREQRYNLARSLLDGREPRKAVEILEKIGAEEPEALRYQGALAQAYHYLGRNSECRELVERLIPKDVETPLTNLALANLELVARRPASALNHLKRLEQADSKNPALHVQLGIVYVRMQRWDQAAAAFQRALQLDADNGATHQGLAMVALGQDRSQEAVDHALQAEDLMPHSPLPHYYLGIALVRSGHFEEAVQAFQNALAIESNFVAAHRRLATLYRQQLGDFLKSAEHQVAARRILQEREAARREAG